MPKGIKTGSVPRKSSNFMDIRFEVSRLIRFVEFTEEIDDFGAGAEAEDLKKMLTGSFARR